MRVPSQRRRPHLPSPVQSEHSAVGTRMTIDCGRSGASVCAAQRSAPVMCRVALWVLSALSWGAAIQRVFEAMLQRCNPHQSSAMVHSLRGGQDESNMGLLTRTVPAQSCAVGAQCHTPAGGTPSGFLECCLKGRPWPGGLPWLQCVMDRERPLTECAVVHGEALAQETVGLGLCQSSLAHLG